MIRKTPNTLEVTGELLRQLIAGALIASPVQCIVRLRFLQLLIPLINIFCRCKSSLQFAERVDHLFLPEGILLISPFL